MKERLKNLKQSVVCGITAFVASRLRCAWYWKRATGNALLTSKDSTKFMVVVEGKVSRHSGHDLDRAVLAHVVLRVAFLSDQLERCYIAHAN